MPGRLRARRMAGSLLGSVARPVVCYVRIVALPRRLGTASESNPHLHLDYAKRSFELFNLSSSTSDLLLGYRPGALRGILEIMWALVLSFCHASLLLLS